jgi:hypothetical protein
MVRRSPLRLKETLTIGTDDLIKRNREVLSFEAASHRDMVNLQNWVDGNGCIAREETAYLALAEDLISVASPNDSAMTWLGALVEDSCIFFRERFGQVRKPHLTLRFDAKHSKASPACHLERPKRAHISSVLYSAGSQSPDDTIHHCPAFGSRLHLQLRWQLDC